MTKSFLILALALSAAACSKPEAPATAAGPTCEGSACVPKLTVEEAKNYFSQFNYKVAGTCDDQSKLRFTWLTSKNHVVVAKDAAGNDIVAELNLFMNDDGTYTGKYQENIQQLVDPGYYKNIGVQNARDLTGTWSVEDTSLVLSEIGTGVAAKFEMWTGVTLNVAGTSLNPTLDKQTLSMMLLKSPISKDLKTVSQYCTAGN